MSKLLELIAKLDGEVKRQEFRSAMITLHEVRRVLDTYQNAC
jgi:hypothetical protein